MTSVISVDLDITTVVQPFHIETVIVSFHTISIILCSIFYLHEMIMCQYMIKNKFDIDEDCVCLWYIAFLVYMNLLVRYKVDHLYHIFETILGHSKQMQ